MKYAKIIIMLALAILIFGAASVCASDVNDTATADAGQIELSAADESAIPAQGNDESSAQDSEILGEDTGTYSELYDEIQKGGDVTLKHKYYKYNSASGIMIVGDDRVIDGNGTVIDLAASSNNTELFEIYGLRVTIKNMTIINANYMVQGGAICFTEAGTVTNCNFINNHAPKGGAIYFFRGGEVSNCNFTNNTATSGSGGAIYVENREFIVTNCNFTNNTATTGSGGAIYYNNDSRGNLIGSSFKDNKATGQESYGGAVYFNNGGNVTSCRFIDNMAPQRIGGAVYFYAGESSVADSVFINNSAGNFSAVHLSFAVGNISGCLFINNTAEFGIVGQAWESYEQMSVSNNIFLNNSVTLYVIDFADNSNLNVDCNWFGSDETDYANNPDSPNCKAWLFLNATANPDAISVGDASDILFKLQMYNSTSVNVTGYNNGLLYPVNLTVTPAKGNADKKSVRLDEPLTYTATAWGCGSITASIGDAAYTVELRIAKANSTLTVENMTFDYNSTGSVQVSFFNATGVVANVAGHPEANVTVNGNTITVSNLAAGNYTLNVTTAVDDNHNPVSKTAGITVNKLSAEIILVNETLDLKVNQMGTVPATLTPEGAGDPAYVSSNESVIIIESGFFLATGKGTATITVSFAGNENYTAAENRTIRVTVTLNDASVSVKNSTLDLKVGERFDLNATSVPHYLNIEYASSNQSVASVTDYGIVTAVGEGTAIITLTVGNNETYALNSTNVTVKVSKIASEIVANSVSIVYNTDEYLTITLKDATGKAISGASVNVNLNGDKAYTTDANGQIKVSTKGLDPNAYTAKVTFNGNAKYLPTAKDVKVTVKKAKPKITAKKKTYKSKNKKKRFTITLKDNRGKAIKNAKVRLIVKKITTKKAKKKTKTTKKKKKNILKTNKKGKATFKVNRNKKGKYQAIIKYKGNKYYTPITKKVKITIK